jgi:hypothetical protein
MGGGNLRNVGYIAGLASGLALGVNVSRPSTTTLSWSYGFTGQFYELRNGSSPLAPLPVPVSGTNSGVGDFSIADIFPSAAKVASGATVSGSGVLIESAPLNRQGAPSHASLSVSGDNRSWFNPHSVHKKRTKKIRKVIMTKDNTDK